MKFIILTNIISWPCPTSPRLCRYFLGRSGCSNNTDETVAIIPKSHCKEDCKGKSDISWGPNIGCGGSHYMRGALVVGVVLCKTHWKERTRTLQCLQICHEQTTRLQYQKWLHAPYSKAKNGKGQKQNAFYSNNRLGLTNLTNPSSGREKDLNPGPPDYKSSALPLGHARLPSIWQILFVLGFRHLYPDKGRKYDKINTNYDVTIFR